MLEGGPGEGWSPPWKDLWAGGGLSQGSRVPGCFPFTETPQLFPPRPVSAPCDSVTARTCPTSSPLASLPPEPGLHPNRSRCSVSRCRMALQSPVAEQDSRRVKTPCQGCGNPVLPEGSPGPPAPSLVLRALPGHLCSQPHPVFSLTAQGTSTAGGTGATWTRWPHCSGSRRTLPALEGIQAL